MNEKKIYDFNELDDPAPVILDAETKTATVAVLENADYDHLEISDEARQLALDMCIDLSGTQDLLIQHAIDRANQSHVLEVEAGLFLLAAKSKCAHGEFTTIIESYGFSTRRAREWMAIASLTAKLPEDERENLLMLGKRKLLTLSQEEPEFVTHLLKSNDVDLKIISSNEMQRLLREEKAAHAQASVELKKTELENEKLQSQLQAAIKARADSSDIVPPHVSDIRLETAALYKKAELSIDGIARLTPDIHLLDGEWALSSARSAFAALQGLIAQAKGVAAELHRTYGADLDGDHSTMERLTQKELFKCATEYKELIGEHEHEAALRAYERDLEKPKGKGRPKAPPKLD